MLYSLRAGRAASGVETAQVALRGQQDRVGQSVRLLAPTPRGLRLARPGGYAPKRLLPDRHGVGRPGVGRGRPTCLHLYPARRNRAAAPLAAGPVPPGRVRPA
jgi:hypothetical protein